MATFNTAFGSLPGTNEMLGTTNTTGGGQQNTYNPQRQFRSQQTSYGQAGGQPQQTFAQLQKQGMARPAPAAPQAQPVQQFGGSQQAQQMRQNLQQQLQQFSAAPSRFDTKAFQQIRGAQAANLQSDFTEQQRQLNEDLARRGLSASSIAGSGLARLGGAQSRALADLDAQLLQRAAETQAQDRAQLLQSGQGLAELAGSQDLSQFEANRVAQAAEFENQLRAAQFGQQQYEQGTQQALQAAQAEQAGLQFGDELGLRLGELTGQVGGAQTLAAGQQAEQRRQFDIQQALQQQLGVGNLALEQARLSQQGSQFQQQLSQEATQFGLSLNEQQIARNQQLGISNQELALERDRIVNQNLQAGQQLSAQVAQNQAQNNLEQARINEAIASRGEGARQFNLEQSLRQAMAQTEATGYNYIPLTTGASVGAVGGVLSGQTLAREAQTSQQSLANLDLNLRRQLGVSELSGLMYDPTGTQVTATPTVGARAQQSQAQIAQAQQQMAANQYQSELLTALLSVLRSIPAPK